MDIGATVTGIPMDEPSIAETARTIRAGPSDDGIAFSLGRI